MLATTADDLDEFEYDDDRPPVRNRPHVAGSLAFLLLSFPLGILWFVLLVTLLSVTISTAIVWIGLGVGAVTLMLWRGGAHAERARVYALLDVWIPAVHRPLPEKRRWRARLSDPATWRELAYLILLFPIGIVEFVLTVTSWSVALGLAALPVYYRFLPTGSWRFPTYGEGPVWFVVDSIVDALPFAAVGFLLLGVAVQLTRSMAAGHARFALYLLGPVAR